MQITDNYARCGVVGQAAILTDLDGVGGLGQRETDGQESGNNGGETHLELGRKGVWDEQARVQE